MTTTIIDDVEPGSEKMPNHPARRFENAHYFDAERDQITCKCPKCGKHHVVQLRWAGRGTPRIFCSNCRPTSSASYEWSGEYLNTCINTYCRKSAFLPID